MLVNVKVESDTLLKMLMARVYEFRHPDEITTELFEQYYSNLIENGCFENSIIDIREIVDNDYVNFKVVSKEGLEHMRLDEDSDKIIVKTIVDGEDYYLIDERSYCYS